MIAPEGTTKHGNVLLRFSTGAFVPGRPVLPVSAASQGAHPRCLFAARRKQMKDSLSLSEVDCACMRTQDCHTVAASAHVTCPFYRHATIHQCQRTDPGCTAVCRARQAMTMFGPCHAQVLLKYQHKHFNVGWGITNTPWHIYRMLTQFANFLEVGLKCPPRQRRAADIVLPVVTGDVQLPVGPRFDTPRVASRITARRTLREWPCFKSP